MNIHCNLIKDVQRINPRSVILKQFKYHFRKVWFPTLQAMSRLERNHTQVQAALRSWLVLGSLLGLREDDEAPAHSCFMGRVQSSFPRGQTNRCHWSECLCSDDRHVTWHSRRICKGCKRAHYCSSHCQKSDWESGIHRQECRQWRAQV
ncbi:hypothetical protein K474DRAFT_380740 [Panus rudis PR-1116 ss-1]|nr:hypothetical protein K474DRAFT_380740 [Panus rudis PR-1116 ss-1]